MLSHDVEMRYNYNNRASQELWGYTWGEYQGMDSWRSTPATEEEAMAGRRRLWAHMEEHGRMLGFEGLRVSKAGELFTIKDVTVWTVDSDAGDFLGHAVVFDTWELGDGRLGHPRGHPLA